MELTVFIKLCGFIVLIIILYYKSYKPRLRSRYINNLLIKNGDPDLFLYELEKEISKAKTLEYKRMLLVNKTSGLVFKGRWREAVNLLNEVNDRFTYEIYTVVYYINYISALFYMGRTDEAITMYSDNKELFERYDKYKSNRSIHESVKELKGMVSFYNNNLKESREMFQEIINSTKNNNRLASCYYFLGMICQKESNIEECKDYFKKAKLLAKNSFISKVI